MKRFEGMTNEELKEFAARARAGAAEALRLADTCRVMADALREQIAGMKGKGAGRALKSAKMSKGHKIPHL